MTSKLQVDNIEGRTTKGSMNITEGSTTTSIQKGLIKGFSVIFKQSDNSSGDTFNLSSVTDASTGKINYAHANPYISDDGYIAIPNDGNYGYTMIAPQDLTTTACSQFSFSTGDSLSDTVMAAAFGGDLA